MLLSHSFSRACLVSEFKLTFSHFNNITHFFTHTYFKKLQTTILKLLYQTPPNLSLSQDKFLIVFSLPQHFVPIKAQSKDFSYISSNRSIYFILFLSTNLRIFPISFQCKSKKFVPCYSSFSSYFSSYTRTSLIVAVPSFLG